MKLISTHSHLLTEPRDLDNLVENGIFSSIWLLQLPSSMHISELYPHPATEEETLDAAKRHPGCLLPFKWVDFRLGPEQIDQAVDRGFVGFKGICPQNPYDDDRYLPIYERINHYRSCMVFHTGYVSTPHYGMRSPGLGYRADAMRPSALRALSLFFPDMTFVAAHFGLPWENELLDPEVLMTCPNIFIDISGGQWERMKAILERHACLPASLPDGGTGILADRLLFGVDAYLGHPQLHQDITEYCRGLMEYFEEKQAAGLPWSNHVQGILHGNAVALQKRNGLIG